MRLGPVALLLTLCLLPIAAAQVPTPPDPEDAILLVCDVAGGIEPQARALLPCPQSDPAAPADHDHAAAPPAPAGPDPSPEDVTRLADEVATRVEEIPEDPETAPEKILEIVALVVDFAKKVLSVPSDALAAVRGAMADAKAAIDDAKGTLASGAKGALADAIEAIRSLLDKPQGATKAVPKLPTSAPVKAPKVSLPLDGLRQALLDA